MTVFILLFLITLFVAYANGANDNFKGVATLYGANVAGYKKAITIATIATFAGCVAAVFLAEGLVKAFSGRGSLLALSESLANCRRRCCKGFMLCTSPL